MARIAEKPLEFCGMEIQSKTRAATNKKKLCLSMFASGATSSLDLLSLELGLGQARSGLCFGVPRKLLCKDREVLLISAFILNPLVSHLLHLRENML